MMIDYQATGAPPPSPVHGIEAALEAYLDACRDEPPEFDEITPSCDAGWMVMTWNYRLVRYADGGYGLHEVYYDLEGKPTTPTCEPIRFFCDEEEGPESIRRSLSMALDDARKQPVLQLSETWAEMMQPGAPAGPVARLRELVAAGMPKGWGADEALEIIDALGADPEARPPSLAALRRLDRGLEQTDDYDDVNWREVTEFPDAEANEILARAWELGAEGNKR